MNVYISYSHHDKKYADLIANSLREHGHKVWIDTWRLKAGDNLIEKINEGLKETEALIVIVSNNSLGSEWVRYEFSAIALGDISSEKRRIIPVLVDKVVSLPEYLSQYLFVDLTVDTEIGLQQILNALKSQTKRKKEVRPEKKREYDNAINVLSQELRAGRLTLICGAGVSVDAGIPSWDALLLNLLKRMISRISQGGSSSFKNADPNEFQKRYGSSSLILGRYLKLNLGDDFLPELRDVLYAANPQSCEIIDAIVELARPQRNGEPLESIVTFNFDVLIEENLHNSNIRYKSIYTEDMRHRPTELPIYHVHGYLPRNGKIPKNADVVFSEDTYHSQFIEPFSWSNLVQLNKLNQNTCLFLGISLTDPNLRRLLDVANRKNSSNSLNHYIIKKEPNLSNENDTIDKLELLLEEQDANGLGLNLLWVKDFKEITPLLRKIAS